MSEAKEVVQGFYGAFARGDVPSALGLLAPDVEWTEAERSPYFGGTWRGLDAIVSGLFQRLGADFEGFAAAPGEFVSEGDRVVVLGNYSGRAKTSGRELAAPFVHSWTVENGKLKRFVQYTDTALWMEALGRG
ncbi:MAG: nuclear transport factor 2 family protein [Caulobacteraceae bacterium]